MPASRPRLVTATASALRPARTSAVTSTARGSYHQTLLARDAPLTNSSNSSSPVTATCARTTRRSAGRSNAVRKRRTPAGKNGPPGSSCQIHCAPSSTGSSRATGGIPIQSARQSPGSSSPISHSAGRLQPDTRPRASATRTCQW